MEENSLSWKEQQKKNLKSALMESALSLFEKRGIDDTSVEDIVRKTGIAKGTFYLYFDSKTSLITEAVLDGLSNLEKSILISQEQQSITTSLISLFECLISFFKKNRWLAKMFLYGQAFDSDQLGLAARNELKSRYNACTIGIIEKLLRKGMLQSIYKEIDPLINSRVIYGGIKEIIITTDSDNEDINAKDIALIFEKGLRK